MRRATTPSSTSSSSSASTAINIWSIWKHASASAAASRICASATTACQGYYIEINRSLADKVPTDYHRRQTVKNAERYITPELKEFEDKVLGARDRALAREKQLYDELLDLLIAKLADLQGSAAALAALDVLSNLAERAVTLALRAAGAVRRSGDSDHRRSSSGRRTFHRSAVRAQRSAAERATGACW